MKKVDQYPNRYEFSLKRFLVSAITAVLGSAALLMLVENCTTIL